VVKTERVYTTILSHIVNVFLNPLKESNLIKDGVITEENRRKIFPGALATLAQVHKDFLNGLEARVDKWGPASNIGDLFLTMIPYFKLYPVYVSDFENQMKALKEAKNNERFWEFVKGGFALLKDPSNDLPSLLITPVQRIPRYLMLVNQLLKYTWPSHRDYANMKSAATQLGKIAEYVDQKAKDAENVQKMHHVQEILLGKYETLLDPQRRFVNQGVVFEVRGKEVRMMGLFHFSDMVVWAKVKKIEKKVEPKKGDKAKKKPEMIIELEYHYQSRVPLMNCSLSGVEDQSKTIRNCFYLRTPEKNYLVACDSPEAKRQWMLELNESIQDVNVKAATLRKQVAMVEEKKATMRQARLSEEEKRKPLVPAVTSTTTSATPAAALTAAVASANSGAGTGAAAGGGAPSVAKPRRSGWLLKRKEDKATAVTTGMLPAIPEEVSASTEDTQSEEDADADGKKKKDRQNKGLFRGPSTRTGGAPTTSVKSGEPQAAAVPVLPKKAEHISAPNVTAGGSGGSAVGAVVVVVEEKRKRAGWLGGRASKPTAGKEKWPDRRASESQVDEGAEVTMNLSPGVSAVGEALGTKTNALKDDEDAARLRRGSRILNLDSLPTMDAKGGAAQMAELKAAFDGLEGDCSGALTPRRRRSLSAPDLLMRSASKSNGPSFVDSGDEDSDDNSASSTPLRPLKPSTEQPALPNTAAEFAAEAMAKRLKKLKALKRGSLSGMDITKHVAARRGFAETQAKSSFELSGAAAAGAPVSTTTLGQAANTTSSESGNGAKTPPRPGRKAPVLVGFDSISQVKAVTRRASEVVMENSDDEDESPIAGLLKLGSNVHLNEYSHPARSPPEGEEELSSSSDLEDEEKSAGEEKSPTPGAVVFVSSVPVEASWSSAASSGYATPDNRNVLSSGEVTPKAAVVEAALPPPPEKMLHVSPRPEEKGTSFSVAQVPDSLMNDDEENPELDRVVLTTPMMRTLTSAQNISTSTEQLDEDSGELSDSEEADFAD
jgi:hypothetical protein